jgi:rhodanese-related sulfurtransferase
MTPLFLHRIQRYFQPMLNMKIAPRINRAFNLALWSLPISLVLLLPPGALSQTSTNTGPASSARSRLKPGAPKKVDVPEFEALLKDKETIVLDVRTQPEFQAGHIPNAINLDVNSPDFENKIAALDTNKVYLVHCAAGKRSTRACDTMARKGFPYLVNLEPGFNGWLKAGKPIEK